MTGPAVTARALRDLELSPGGTPVAGVSRFVIVLAVTGTILLALGAFWL